MDDVARRELARKLGIFYSSTYDRFKAGEKTFKTNIGFKVDLFNGLEVPYKQDSEDSAIQLEDLGDTDVSEYRIEHWRLENKILEAMLERVPLHVVLKGEKCKLEFIMDNDKTKYRSFEVKFDDDAFAKEGKISQELLTIVRDSKLLVEDPHVMNIIITNVETKSDKRKEFEKEILIDPKQLMNKWFDSKKEEHTYSRPSYSYDCIKEKINRLRTKDARVAMINLLWKVNIPKSRTVGEMNKIFDDLPNTTFGIVNIDDGYLLMKAVEDNNLDVVRKILGRTGYLSQKVI